MVLQKIREIAPGIVQNPGINSGRPIKVACLSKK